MNLMCTRCKQRVAMIFVTRMDDGQPVNEGYCLQCAKEVGIPQIKEMIDNLGVSEEDLEAMAGQLMDSVGPGEDGGEDGRESGFEPGGARSFPAFLQNFISGAVSSASPSGEDEPAIREKPGREPAQSKTQKKAEKQKKYKYLDNYCENLTEKAAAGKIDRIVGRDREIYRVMQILNRRTKNNPCLIGEPGVGKTAIAEGIAQRLADGSAPPKVQEKKLYLLDLTALVAGTQFRGQFESRVKGLVEDIKQAGNVILFIDEVHNLIGAGDAEGSMNAANILKPALSRGEIQVIGATTFAEYRKYIEKDAALERRFQPVTVNEPSIEETVEVLLGVKGYYEEFHRVRVPEEVVRRAVVMSERYITDRYLPDKAIDLLDEACSCSTLENGALTEYEALNRKLKTLREQESAIEQQTDVDYAKLAEVRSEILRTEASAQELEPKALDREVTVDDLARVVELWTGIPASKIKESELKKVAGLSETLKAHIIGQDEAVELVAAAVRRTRVSLSAKKRPASFIFVGPTGVGKTELVKQLSSELFQAADPLIRLDMSEFMEKHSVSRIIGSPPGYVGYDEAGQLTEKVRRKPYSVVLFDEIEKAHPDVLNILLQILDEGKITDAQGRVVSFENTVIVMTSNAGSNLKTAAVGFNRTRDEQTRERAEKALAEFLRPEFLARVDEIVVFRSLTEEDYRSIAALMLDELRAPLKEREIRFDYDDAAVRLIAQKAFGGKSGARDIRRVIRREVEDKLTQMVVENGDSTLSAIQLTAKDGELVLLSL